MDKKKLVFRYLDNITNDMEISVSDDFESMSLGAKLTGVSKGGVTLFLYYTGKNHFWFNRDEAKIIRQMFDINLADTVSYSTEYFSKKLGYPEIINTTWFNFIV